MQHQFGDWLAGVSYLGNHSSHLWRATELNPAVFGPGATTGNTNQRRMLILQNATQGQFYGTIGQLDDTGRANYGAMLLSLQRRLKNNLSVLSNYTLSKCMSDPATTELTGPTIVNPANPDLDYSYCASDRRHVLNVSLVVRTPDFENPDGAGDLQRLADLADRPLAVGQPFQHHHRRGQRVDGSRRPASGAGARRSVRHRRSDRLPESRGVHVADDRHLQHAGAVHDREPEQPAERFRADPDVQVGGAQNVQFRWEVFNLINHVNFNAPITALNSASFGQIQTAGDPRIMQFALKFTF